MRISDWSSDVCSSDLAFKNAIDLFLQGDPGEGFDDVAIDTALRRLDDLLATVLRGHHQYRRRLQCRIGADCLEQVDPGHPRHVPEIGRASCRERVCQYV